MARITQCSPVYGMPDNTPVVPGVKAKCDELGGRGKGCGTEFVTEGNESYAIWMARGDGSMGSGANEGWVINCPRCGRGVHVRHPLMPPEEVRQNISFCFVATCCFGDLDAPEVARLRRWRDEKLFNSVTGRRFIAWYYSGFGNRAATFIGNKPVLRRIGRAALGLFIRLAVR